MRTVDVAWDPAGQRFHASGTHRSHEITINAPHPEGAHHSASGFSATELLLAGAGACAAWDVVEILRKQRQDVTALHVRVEGEQDATPPWCYRRIGLHFMIRGRGLDETRIRRAVDMSIERYCSVVATLRGRATVDHTVEVTEEPEVTEAAPATSVA